MKFWPFRKSTPKERKPRGSVPIPFPDDLDDIATMKYHGLRALCGALMDRHSACLSPHPFCGPQGHWQKGDNAIQLIAHVIPQLTPDMTPILGVYLCTAKVNEQSSPVTTESELLEHIAKFTYAESIPNLKMVVNLVDDGTYMAQFGPIQNPVNYDYSTGRVDPNNIRLLYCNPEPSQVKWEYHDNSITEGQEVIPEYHCYQVYGSWWIVDVDRARGMAALVAGIQFADNPDHNFGIHHRTNAYYANANDGSERSKVLFENLPLV